MEKLREITSRALMEAINRPPFGPGFPAEVLNRANTMEVWSITEKAGAATAVEYRLLQSGVVLAINRVSAR